MNLGGGIRLNFSKRGVGASAGVRGFRVGVGPRGKRWQITLPGTGVYFRRDQGWKPPVDVPQASWGATRSLPIGIIVLALLAGLAWLCLASLG